MKTNLLFVYGTLMEGMNNNHFLHGGVPVCKTYLPGTLYANGIPFFKHDPEATTSVEGELWEIDTRILTLTDRLEGYTEGNDDPNWYTRKLINHDVVGPVYAYVVDNPPAYAKHVESGSYHDYIERYRD